MIEEPEAEVVPRDEADDLRVDVIPGRNRVLCGVKNVVRVLMRIRTPTEEPVSKRQPVQVACVLDRSGSMRGQKLEFAKVACAKLVKHLDPCDSLHFIIYDDKVDVVFQNGDLSEAGKDNLRARIQEVRTGGTTNLFGGLQSAATLLGAHSVGVDEKSCSTNTEGAGVRRIFLFSDGCVNAGITDPGEIRRQVALWADQGITTTTFGIGSDFDEPLMRGIAESGKGRYTFLATAQDIPRLVSKSIHDLLKLYASEVCLDVRGGAHTTVARVYGGGDEHEDNCEASLASGLLQMGDLHSANERMVLMELDSAPPGDCADGLCFNAAKWNLSFQRKGALTQFSGNIELVATQDRGALGHEAASVRANFAIRLAAELDLEVADHLAKGDHTRAKEVIARQVSQLQEALDAARNEEGIDASDIKALERVLRREQSVAERIKEGEDTEVVRRHCIQEHELNRCMSVAAWSDGVDSDDDTHTSAALQRRLRDFDDLNDSDNDVGSSVGTLSRSRSRTPSSPGSPRPLPTLRAAEAGKTQTNPCNLM